MSTFIEFRDAVNNQFKKMIAAGEIYTSNASKDELKTTYLEAFPEGTNPIYKTNTEHHCSCCFHFIRSIGNTLSIINGSLVSVWDIKIDGHYQVVADAMSILVKQKDISNHFRSAEKHIGAKSTKSLTDNEVKSWDHFYCTLPNSLMLSKHQIDTYLGKTKTNYQTLKRALDEITVESLSMVTELITQNSLYRGSEFMPQIKLMKKAKKTYNSSLDVWKILSDTPSLSVFRNSVIGTLLVDLSEGKDLEQAVKAYEFKVAPANYKRPTALITQGMIKKAQEKTKELGIESALQRRYATIDDISINDILFADNGVKQAMGLFDSLSEEVSDKIPSLDKIQEVPIDKFISDILPTADSMELMFTNDKESSLVTLIAPQDSTAPSILKWNNNFSWSYKGEVTDSMKENVKSAGGNVDGVLRFSIQWNDKHQPNLSDLDAHCKQPNGRTIYYGSKADPRTSGSLDVDIMNPRGVAVENIVFTNLSKMPAGNYDFMVHNFSGRSGQGFTAEIECNGETFAYDYPKKLRQKEKVTVATVKLDKNKVFTVDGKIPSDKSVKEIWNLSTQKFHKVNMVMMSPNYWDDQQIGNKHYFFMLDNCINPDDTRGFYNEFLPQELNEHRKVFEVLASKMKVPHSTEQLSGLGFSSTINNEVICRVKGTFNRVIKIKF